MKRGWILLFSVMFNVGLVIGIYYLPIPVILKLVLWPAGIVVLDFCLVYFWWARHNLFFTFIPEGRAKIVVRGDKFKKVLIQWEGKIIKKPGDTLGEGEGVWDVIEGISSPRFFGGLRLYGFWPFDDIYLYDFSWTGIGENGDLIPHPEETLDYVLLQDDIYWCKATACEDKKLLPLDVEALLTMRVVNPYKVLFIVQNWLEIVVNRTKTLIRNEITKDTYETLTTSREAVGKAIWDGSEPLRVEYEERYGVKLRKLEVKEIDPPAGFRETTLAKFIAEKESEAIIVRAGAEAQKIRTVNTAIKEFESLGSLKALLDTLEKSPGQGAKWVIPLPGMADLLTQVLPGAKGNIFQPEDIQDLRKIIEQFQQAEPSPKPPSEEKEN